MLRQDLVKRVGVDARGPLLILRALSFHPSCLVSSSIAPVLSPLALAVMTAVTVRI